MQHQYNDAYETCNHERDYHPEEDSGFKAWQVDSLLMTEHSHSNMLRNFKSQLLTYQQKYKRLDVGNNRTLPVKLPVMGYARPKKPLAKQRQSSKGEIKQSQQKQQSSRTERKPLNPTHHTNLLKQHKSIDLGKKPTHSYKLQSHNLTTKHAIHNLQHQPPTMVTKVQQMKFLQKQKRVRKRDLYLAIFGQRGKGKVQRLEFGDQNENEAYLMYVQKKNLQVKGGYNISTNGVIGQEERSHMRCSSQVNTRYHVKKSSSISQQSTNFIAKNNTQLPMRY